MDQLVKHSWSRLCYSTLITRGSAGRAQLVTLLFLSTHHQWISWQSTAGHNSVTLHSSPVDQLEEHSWSHCCYSPLNTRVAAGREQLVTLMLLSTHQPWISWQSTAGHTSVTLHSSPVDQLADHSWSHFCYSPLITRGSAGRVQLVTLLLLSTHHPWISWKSTAGHTSITLHLSPVDQLAEHSWVQFLLLSSHHPSVSLQSTLVTLRFLSTQHPCVSGQSTAGHTSVTFHSSPVDQLAEHSWSHLLLSSHHPCVIWQSTLVTLRLLSTKHRVSAARVQLVTLLLLSTHNPWIKWQSTAGHSSVTLHSSPVD